MDPDLLQRRITARPPRLHQAGWMGRKAAVAVIFQPGEAGPEVLFIRRSDREGDPWSGHMAFPGGKLDPGDPDPLATAVRETREEVGLDLGEARLLGQLDDNVSPSRLLPARLVISAFAFWLEEPAPPLTPNPEVAGIHWFTLRRFLAGEGRGTMDYTFAGVPLTLPAVYLEGARIWGLTLRIVDDLLDRLGGAENSPLP